MKRKLLIIAALFTIVAISCAQNGKLEKGKESLNTTNATNSAGKKSTKSSRSKVSDTNDNDLINPFAEIIWGIFAYSVYGILVESPWEINGRMHSAEISNYPYKEKKYGNFIYTDSTNYNVTRFDITNNFVIENSNLYGNNFGLDFRFLKRFSLDLGSLYLTEKTAIKKEGFSLYSALLKYHRVRTQKFDAWFGLGVMYVGSDVNKSGVGLGFGAEWFLKKPISLQVSHKWSYINSNEVHNTKLLLKYHLKNYHISSGYEHFKIGVSKIDAFSIGVGICL